MGSTSDLIRMYAILTLVIIFLVPTCLGRAQHQETAIISGKVLDENNEPIPNAIIRVVGPGYLRRQAAADSSGTFQVIVDREGWYSVYAIFNRSETNGVDYVPALWRTYLQLGSTATFAFALERGASLYLDEELWFVESREPADYCSFVVTRPNGEPLSGKNSIYTYGSDTDSVWLFGFSPRLAIVPADTEVAIQALAEIDSPPVSRPFTIKGRTGYFKLRQGEMLYVDIREYTLDCNVANLRQMLDSAFTLLKDADDAGFLVTVERRDLLNAYSLIDSALLAMKKGLCDESFAELRRAYLLTSRTIEGLQGLLQTSSQSAFILSLLFVFIASASAYLFTERESHIEVMMGGTRKLSFSLNPLIAVIFYAVLFLCFYFSYPGCRLVPQTSLIPAAAFALLMGQLVVARSPRSFSEKKGESRSIQFRSAIIVAFSMACRNLRRRKIRTVLTLGNTMILIFGFITFTSISPGYGLVERPLRPTIPIHALLIRAGSFEVTGSHFSPLSSSFITWLKSQPNVTLISPKAENVPLPIDVRTPIGFLYTTSGEKITVQGVIGIMPSVEGHFTQINNTIVDGKFLLDEDNNGILISSSLRDTLDVGDKLYGFAKEFVIKGFFDKTALERIVDIDGQLFIPKGIDARGTVVPCSGDQVIITNYEAALILPKVAVSRALVELEDSSTKQYSDFAQIVALTRDYEVYVSHPNSLHLLYLGGYVEEQGVGLLPFLLILVVLNISATVLGSVKERRDEIASLSSIGLNPTHIAALFVAEAAVIGFVGGGLGYLLGTSGYRLAAAPLFGALEVREKASAEWGLIALLLSGLAAIVASIIPALQASTIVTPSLLRKWSVRGSGKPTEAGQPWVIDLPIRLLPREVEPFTGFILARLREKLEGKAGAYYVTNIEVEEEVHDVGPSKKLSFNYELSGRPVKSRNELVLERMESHHLDVKLLCFPLSKTGEAVRGATTYVRSLILEWNAMTVEVATPYDLSLSQLYTLVNAYNPTTLYVMTTEPDLMEKLDPLRRVLISEGLRPPKFVISRVNPLDIEQCMKAAEELVSRADVICVSGEPDVLCTALAISAQIQKKPMCFVVDPRPIEVRMRDPFRILELVNM